MEEQKNTTDWLTKEIEETKNESFNEDRKPALKLEENKITEMVVDFSKPFEVWEDHENNTKKKLVPVTVKGEEFIWWLNVKNPVYHSIIVRGSDGQTTFKILQTGTQKNTKYTIVE